MNDPLYSIRMRASREGTHISGAERIVSYDNVGQTADQLATRAMRHERGRPDSITISSDALDQRDIITLPPLKVRTFELHSVQDARDFAVSELEKAGVSWAAALNALDHITNGASSCGVNMRGAMIVDAASGKRLEPDVARGVRARAVDYDAAFLPVLTEALVSRGIDRTHLREALALATKVANAPNAVAELCISDDPSYVTGYVASLFRGYARLTPLKDTGCPMGGRAFFVDTNGFFIDEYISYMRETPVLINGIIEFA
jgi:6-carboxyhexanoate--CoA ligase